MILAHLSDLHAALEEGDAEHKGDSTRFLPVLFDRVNQVCKSKNTIAILTGDIVDDGSFASYQLFEEIILDLQPPFYLVAGNHDNREALRKMVVRDQCPEHLSDNFLQYSVDFEDVRLIVLDTVVDGAPYGMLCDDRLKWLEQELKRTRKPAVIAMHHPPLVTDCWFMSQLALKNPERFLGVINSYREQVHLICCGHNHRALITVRNGVTIAIAPSGLYQLSKSVDPRDAVTATNEGGGFMLHQFSGTSWSHTIQFLESRETGFPLVSDWTRLTEDMRQRGWLKY